MLAIINFNVLFKNGADVYVNDTYHHTVCWIQEDIPKTMWIKTWNQVHIVLYSYIPFGLLVIANALLVHQMTRKKSKARSRTRSSKQRSMNITILVLTILFVIFTGISTIVTIFYSLLMASYSGLVIAEIGDILGFSFHALNILSLMAMNKAFRHEFLIMIGIRKDLDHRASSQVESVPKLRVRL